MNKIILSQYLKGRLFYPLFTFVGFVIAATTLAATVSFSPVKIGPREGENISLTVAVDPQGVKTYTVKLQITYPKDLVEVQSFTFGNGWMPLVQPGFNLIDNTNGILIKTAGYPGGFNSKADVGTIIFKAKKNGAGAVQVETSSLALGADNQNLMSGLPVKASVVITQSTPTQQKEKTPAPNQTNNISPSGANNQNINSQTKIGEDQPKNETVAANQASEQPRPPQNTPTPAQKSLLAAVGSALTLGTGRVLVAIGVLAAAMGSVFVLAWRFLL